MLPMFRLDALDPSDRILLWTLVGVARADGNVAPLEATFIEKAMDVLGLDPDGRLLVRATLLGDSPLPALDPEAAVAPERRLRLFEDAVQLAFADGDVAASERPRLDRLISALGIARADSDRVWEAARAMFEEEE